MNEFKNCTIKREVQHILFTNVNKKGVKITGLSGSNIEEYSKILKNHFNSNNIKLVDFNIKGENIINNKISNVKPTLVMDCDFCDTIINSGEELLKVYNNMTIRYPNKEKILAFTFSNRMSGGLQKTLDWLNTNIYKESLQLNNQNYSKCINPGKYWRIIGHNQNNFNKSILISYRDSVSMLSGIISWI